MPEYYMLECFEPDDWEDGAGLRGVPLPSGEDSWRFGRRFRTQPEVPIPIAMIETHGDRLRDLYKVDALVMSHRLYDALKEAGVNNIDAYDAVIRHPKTGFETRDYVAGNLVGIVAAADMGSSNVVGGSADGLLDVDFEGLAIDPAAVRGLLMFRLVENTSAVIVHEKVKSFLESQGFDQLSFLPPEEWIG